MSFQQAINKAKLSKHQINLFKMIKELAYIKDVRDDYRRKGLGKALDDIFNIEVFKADSGTLKSYYKTKFADIFYKENITWKLMSQDAKDLILKMYEFIIKHNQT